MTEANISGPWLVHTADSVDSTQKWVRQRVSSLTDRSVLLASSQTEGRGRPGRTWLSPPGGFYASFLLKPSPPVSFSPCVSLLAALLLSRIMLRRGLDARVKWPNDVLVRGRKLAGIVAETGNRPESWFILGVGVNLQVAPVLRIEGPFPPAGGATSALLHPRWSCFHYLPGSWMKDGPEGKQTHLRVYGKSFMKGSGA